MKQGILSLVLLFCSWTLIGQIPFFQEQFDGDTLPDEWSTADVSGNLANQLVLWDICMNPMECPPSNYFFFKRSTQKKSFDAPSAGNGYAYSHAFPANLNGNSTPFRSQLTSSTIDCSDHSEVHLTFTTFISNLLSEAFDNAQVLVSIDSMSWTPFQIYPGLGLSGDTLFTTNPLPVTLDISSVAAGAPNVYIRWEWTGTKEFVWCLDDVRLYDTDPYYFKAVWGHLPGQGDFSNGLNGWTVDNSVNPAFDQGWIWSPLAYFGDALLAPDGFYLGSKTPLDGAAIMNADSYSTNGGTSGPPNPWPCYVSSLVSPTIDLSDVDQQLAMKFTQVASLNTGVESYDYFTSYSYSLDDGATWSVPLNANLGLYVNSKYRPAVRYFPLPEELLGESTVKIRFTFAGKFFAWGIDDVVIYERADFDLELKRNFFAVAPTLMTPGFMVDSLHFLVDVENVGQNLQEEVRVMVEVRDKSSNDMVFTDSLFVGELAVNELAENLIFPNAFLPPMEPTTYQVSYFHKSQEEDLFRINDTVKWEFIITDSILAKETGPTNAFAPQGDNNYSYGNCYYIPASIDTGIYVTDFTFGIGDPEEIDNVMLTILLYQWVGQASDDDDMASLDEMELVGLNTYTVDKDEIDGRAVITIPINEDNSPVLLEKDAYYLAVVKYVNTNPVKNYYMEISEQYDMQATYYLYDVLGKKRYMTMFDQGNDDEFSITGLGTGFDQIPLARLHLTTIVGTRNFPEWEGEFGVQPNPATDFTLLSIQTKEIVSDIRVRIFDIQGKLWMDKNLGKGNSFKERVPLKQMPPGTYFVHLQSGKNRKSISFQVHR